MTISWANRTKQNNKKQQKIPRCLFRSVIRQRPIGLCALCKQNDCIDCVSGCWAELWDQRSVMLPVVSVLINVIEEFGRNVNILRCCAILNLDFDWKSFGFRPKPYDFSSCTLRKRSNFESCQGSDCNVIDPSVDGGRPPSKWCHLRRKIIHPKIYLFYRTTGQTWLQLQQQKLRAKKELQTQSDRDYYERTISRPYRYSMVSPAHPPPSLFIARSPRPLSR